MKRRIHLKAVKVYIDGELPPYGKDTTWKVIVKEKGTKPYYIFGINEDTRREAYNMIKLMYTWNGWDLRKEKSGYSIVHNDD